MILSFSVITYLEQLIKRGHGDIPGSQTELLRVGTCVSVCIRLLGAYLVDSRAGLKQVFILCPRL